MRKINASIATSIPLYLQIAENFITRIDAGEYHVGDKLPTERELSEQLNVNRITIRQALNVLEMQGLITRKQGSGTYISQPKIEHPTSQFFWFTRQMKITGRTPGARLIFFEKEVANTVTSRELDITLSAQVYHCNRLRLVNQAPVLLENFYLPADLFPNMEQFDLNQRSLYEIMETEYQIKVSRLRFSLETVPASEYEAAHLEINSGAPVFLERRVTADQNGRIVEFAKDIYRGDRVVFTSDWLSADF